MYYLATTLKFSFCFCFFFPFLPSCTLLSSDWFSLSCPCPLFPIESGFDCTMEKKKNLPLYISVQSGTDVSCPYLSIWGQHCHVSEFNCANRVGGSQKAMSDLELCDNKTSMVYLFFIQINKISIFWLTTDNFHFRNLFSGALMFCL